MAEPKKKKIVSASTGEEVKAGAKKKNVKQAKPVGNSMPYRIGAFALWAVALVLEFIAIFILAGKITWTFLPQLYLIIIALVVLVPAFLLVALYPRMEKLMLEKQENIEKIIRTSKRLFLILSS